MTGRILSYVFFLLAFPLLSSVALNDCGDEVADGRKEGNTLVSRLGGVHRYRACQHVETVYHDGDGLLDEHGWEWVWECESAPTLQADGGEYRILSTDEIRASCLLRAAQAIESWHELVLGSVLLLLGIALAVRAAPPSPTPPH